MPQGGDQQNLWCLLVIIHAGECTPLLPQGELSHPSSVPPRRLPSRGPIFKPWSVLRCHTVMLSSLLLPRRPSSSTHMPRVRRRKQPTYKTRHRPAVAGMQPVLMLIQSFEEAMLNASTSWQLGLTWTDLWAMLSDSDNVNNVNNSIMQSQNGQNFVIEVFYSGRLLSINWEGLDLRHFLL